MKKDTSRVDLHETLKRSRYSNALIATYTFGAPFFEDYCLEKLNCFKENGNITILLDRRQYEDLIVGPLSSIPKQANLRYLLHPVEAGAVFHPKIQLFTSGNKGLLLIGSANLTRPGMTSNAELVASYTFEGGENEVFRSVFRQVFRYFRHFVVDGTALQSNLDATARDSAWLIEGADDSVAGCPAFLHNLERPLWEQLFSSVHPPVDEVFILSRFFDSSPELAERIFRELRPKRINLYTQNGITTLSRSWLESSLFRDDHLRVFVTSYGDDESIQPLHGKAIAVRKGRQHLFAFGSANFTDAALRRTIDRGNAEVCLALPDIWIPNLVERFFDPCKLAVRLRHPDDLTVGEAESPPRGFCKYGPVLIDASLVDDVLRLAVSIPPSLKHLTAGVELNFPGQTEREFQINRLTTESYQCQLPDSVVSRLNQSSCVARVRLEDGDRVWQSNPLLVTNLQDIKTGGSLTRERRVREAEETVTRFVGVLQDLLKGEDENALIQFLTYCDIPVREAPIPPWGRGVRSEADMTTGMRTLKAKNLQYFANLDEATMHFVARHIRKLERHVQHGTIEGVGNFLHIFLAICGVLQSQIERAVIGFEEVTEPINATDWHHYRSLLDRYYAKFRELMDCLKVDYLDSTLQDYRPDRIREEFQPDLKRIEEAVCRVLESRCRIEVARQSKLRILVFPASTVVPKYFDSVLAPTRWEEYAAWIRIDWDGVLKIAG